MVDTRKPGDTTRHPRRSAMGKKIYSDEFRESAVKMVLEQRRQVNETARSLGVLPTTLRYWIKAHHQRARAADTAEEKALRKRVRELETENQKLKLEREILKKAAAYFAREHQP
jgi:transposase